eukprot:ANDGO_07722.mRNA.1 hypothetical protein
MISAAALVAQHPQKYSALHGHNLPIQPQGYMKVLVEAERSKKQFSTLRRETAARTKRWESVEEERKKLEQERREQILAERKEKMREQMKHCLDESKKRSVRSNLRIPQPQRQLVADKFDREPRHARAVGRTREAPAAPPSRATGTGTGTGAAGGVVPLEKREVAQSISMLDSLDLASSRGHHITTLRDSLDPPPQPLSSTLRSSIRKSLTDSTQLFLKLERKVRFHPHADAGADGGENLTLRRIEEEERALMQSIERLDGRLHQNSYFEPDFESPNQPQGGSGRPGDSGVLEEDVLPEIKQSASPKMIKSQLQSAAVVASKPILQQPQIHTQTQTQTQAQAQQQQTDQGGATDAVAKPLSQLRLLKKNISEKRVVTGGRGIGLAIKPTDRQLEQLPPASRIRKIPTSQLRRKFTELPADQPSVKLGNLRPPAYFYPQQPLESTDDSFFEDAPGQQHDHEHEHEHEQEQHGNAREGQDNIEDTVRLRRSLMHLLLSDTSKPRHIAEM